LSLSQIGDQEVLEGNFFDKFAKSNNFNALESEKWYSILRKDVIKAGGKHVLSIYNGSLSKALISLYPELNFQMEKFSSHKLQDNEGKEESGESTICKAEQKCLNYKDKTKRREFFDRIAKTNKFDALDSHNWKTFTRRDIIAQGGAAILKHYKGSFIKALQDLYPELKLQQNKLTKKVRNWKNSRKRKEFFDLFAKTNNFNPMEVHKWYKVTRRDIINAGGKGLLKYHKESHIQALIDLYPALKLKKDQFPNSDNNFKYSNKVKQHLAQTR